jgi:uncharacterized membrane protein
MGAGHAATWWGSVTVPFGFAQPWALLLLPLAILAVALGRRRSGGRWRAASALRAATLIMLVLALAGPSVRTAASAVSTIFVVDRSLSISPQERRTEDAFVREALARMRPQDRAGVLIFAGRPLLRVPVDSHPAVDDLGAPLEPDHTDIGAALELALRVLPVEGARRIVVLSDGAENRGDALAAARVVRAAGVTVDAVSLAPAQPEDVLVDALQAPQEAYVGEVYDVRAVLRATVPAQATVTLSRDGVAASTRRVALPVGDTAIAFPDTATREGTIRYRIDVTATPAALSENKHAEALVVVRGQPRVLFVAATGTQLPAWLSRQHLRIDTRTPQEVPADLTGLAAYGSVVLDDVSALDLSQAQQAALRSFVGTAGGGLLAIGGSHSYGVGGYAGTPLEEILPVSMDIRQTLALPTVAIALIIDTSGSMDAFGSELAKEELAKEIGASVIDLLGEHDQIGVITFNQDFQWLVPLTEARQRARILDQISRLKAGGGTILYPPMRSAWEHLRGSPAKIRHVIVLSDGLTDPGDFRGIVAAMAQSKVTLSTVAIGRDADLEFMRNLARWGGGRAYVAKDLYSVPKIFTAEALMAVRSFIVEEPVPLRRLGADPTLVGLSAPPPLRGYVATAAKPAADVALVGPRGEPILATWRYGLGRTAAFTSDDGSRWTSAWASWPDAARFWSQAVRWTLREDALGFRLGAALEEGGASARAVLNARRPDGAPWDGLAVEGAVAAPGGRSSSIALEQTAPGRYEATWPTSSPGTYVLSVTAHSAGATGGARTIGLVVPYSPEYRVPEGNLGLLSRLVETTGGAFLEHPQEAFRPARGTGSREAWPWLSWGAFTLLLAEVSVRRLPALSQRLAQAAGTTAAWVGRTRAQARTGSEEQDRSYDAADRWAVEKAKFAAEDALRAASMEQAARLFIARLRGTKRP